MSPEQVSSLWPGAAPFQAYFADQFNEARIRWLRLANSLGAKGEMRSYSHPLADPDGASLGTDILWLGVEDARQVVVVISGTHGVEGYAGSAIQRYLLNGIRGNQITVPDGVAILFVHALTPWGMAWYRRCDEHGIDLNRHFINQGQPPANPDFELIRPCLEIEDTVARMQVLQGLEQELGQREYEMAISGGQYVDPNAPFYGGTRPNHGRRVIESLIKEYRLFDRDLFVLDLHTGLGPWGYGELICDHPAGTAGARVALQRFGPSVVQPALGTSSSVPKHGLMDYLWHEGMSSQSCFLTLEFGTYSTQAMFNGLIEDHRYWATHQPSGFTDEGWKPIREDMLNHFFPNDPDWRQSVLLRSLQVFRRALEL